MIKLLAIAILASTPMFANAIIFEYDIQEKELPKNIKKIYKARSSGFNSKGIRISRVLISSNWDLNIGNSIYLQGKQFRVVSLRNTKEENTSGSNLNFLYVCVASDKARLYIRGNVVNGELKSAHIVSKFKRLIFQIYYLGDGYCFHVLRERNK